MMRALTLISLSMLLTMLVACVGQQVEPTPAPAVGTNATPIPYETIDTASLEVVAGQRIYVPAYSLIPTSDGSSTRTLATTLAIHNINDDQSIVITSIVYHDGGGNLVTQYIESGLVLPPLATMGIMVRQDDLSGGIGANFTVEWVAAEEVTAPVTETIMVSTTGSQGLAFTSRGVVVEEF